MSRLFFLPVSLVAAFAAAVIASPVAAVADEAEVQNNSAGAESVSSPDSVQGSEEPTPGWNQADTCEWRIDGGTLILRPLGNGDSGKIFQRPSWGTDFVRFAIEGTVVLSSVSDDGNSHFFWSGDDLFSGCKKLESADLRGLRFGEDTSGTDFSNFLEGLSSLRSVTIDSSFSYRYYGNQMGKPNLPGGSGVSRWVSSVDGIAYECDGYPSGVAATYTLQDKGDVIGSWNQSGTCLWLLDEKGALTVKPQNGSEGTLGQFYAYSDVKRDWLLFPNKISTVVFEDGVKAPGSISGLFQGCSKIKSIDFGSFDTADAENMSYMFDRCSSLKHVDVSMLNTSNAKNMSHMFGSCSSLESLDLLSFNTSKLEDAREMFYSCSALKELDLSHLDASKVSDMSYMFDGCSRLKEINLSNFSTVSARDMDGMFFNCTSLKELDLSSFDTSSVSSMSYFFGDTSSLERITIGDNFITPSGFSFPEHDMSYTELRWKNESGVEFAPNEVPTGKKGTYVVVKKHNPDNPAFLPRIAGETRYETAEQIAYQGSWPTGGSVILASGANFPDALAASALAGEENAPVLLTESRSLSDSTSNVLADLKPSTIYVVGGEAAVSTRAASEASSAAGNAELVRLSGDTRYETALAVASEVGAASDTVIVATAEGYADALSVSPWAFATSSPVILCDPREGLSDSSLSFIRDNGFSKAIIVGGTSAVPGQVESQLKGANIDSTQRLSGPTRYETSAKIAEFELAAEIGFEADGVLFATGSNYPDALSAGPLAGKGLSPLLLVDPGAEQASKFVESHKNEISNATIIGGYSAVSYEEEQTLLGALNA